MGTVQKSMHKFLVLGVLTCGVAWHPEVLAGEVSVNGVEVVPGNPSRVLVQLDSAAPGSAVSSFVMSNPDRLVIDIADAQVVEGLDELAGAGELVNRIETDMFDDGEGMITRLRVFLAAPVEHSIRVGGSQIEVVLSKDESSGDPLAAALDGLEDAPDIYSPEGPPVDSDRSRRYSGPEKLKNEPTVTSLDFENHEEVSRIIVGVQSTTRFTADQPRSNLIVIDVPDAFLPSSLSRVLDTAEFVSPVRLVRAYKTSTGCRVAVSLRSETTYTARYDDSGVIILDIAIPEEMQGAGSFASDSYGEVSPGDNADAGLENAYQKEVLIGSSGGTSDPQVSFGSGSGASDPSQLFGMSSGFMIDNSSASSSMYSGRKISLDFVNADIHSIFRLISHVSRLNIVSGDDVKGTVTVRMEDVPWDQALSAILQAKGLGSQRFGNIIRVAPIETIKTEQQSMMEAKRAEEELTDLEVLILPVNYTQASSLQTQVASLLSTRGSVQVDTTSNQLIIKETEERLAQVRELVRHLDKQTPQVLIEARVVEANTARTRALGIQWGGELNASTTTGYSTGLFFPNNVGASGGLSQSGSSQFYSAGQESLLVDLGADGTSSSIALNLGSIPGLIDLDARLSAMEADGWGKVVSSPRITTLDNKEATISQGQKVPYMSTSSGGTNVKFIQASLKLSVTPHITSDAKVFLDVSISNDRADFSQLVQGQPAIQIKEAETELLVADGDTTVLGGVFSTEMSYSEDRVPGLHRIPIVGLLFKSSSEALTRNELLVFITPHIVTRAEADAD